MLSVDVYWIPILLGFAVIALAARQIGEAAARVRLPLISGYLLAGILVGPFFLGLIPEGVPQQLRFLDEVSLAFIAFAAGAELYLRELRGRLRSIRWVTGGLTFVTFTFGSLAVVLLSELLPFTRDLPLEGRVAVAILAGAILVARSPSSAIAIVNELRAKGPFTRTVLGVTVIMDVVVIVLFAVNTSVADAILTEVPFDLSFIGLLTVELLLALIMGVVLWKLLQAILALRASLTIRAGLVLLAGFGAFAVSALIRTTTRAQLPFEVLVEPLLICMLAGFLVTNYGEFRDVFARILREAGPPVYVVFFTLTGASLALDILAQAWTLAVVLVLVRLGTIFLGSFSGGVLAGDPMGQNRVSWMAYVTQAGVALGLAKEVAVEFPTWGTAFATLMIAVIIVNQLLGPPLFKAAIRRLGEAHTRAKPHKFDGARDAIIFGLDPHSVALAHQLTAHGWQVMIGALGRKLPEQAEDLDVEVRRIGGVTREDLEALGADKAEAIVAMMSDEENYRVCELAFEHFGTKNLVVRLRDRAQSSRFQELGALIVDPSVAIVSLLDHLVRSPEGASLLLGLHQNQDIVDLELRDPMLHGIALKHIRLPGDTLILSIKRSGEWLVSHGYTRLRMGDKVTVVGTAESLEQLALRFEGSIEEASQEDETETRAKAQVAGSSTL